MRTVIGIDPGLSGAIAAIDDELNVVCHPTKSVEAKGRGRDMLLPLFWYAVQEVMDGEIHAFIEGVQAMPHQGASSGFKFGETYGVAKMACVAAGIPFTIVRPQTWMKEFGLKGKNDDQSLAEACRMFPRHYHLFTPERGRITKRECVGSADAALIALYGRRTLNRGIEYDPKAIR